MVRVLGVGAGLGAFLLGAASVGAAPQGARDDGRRGERPAQADRSRGASGFPDRDGRSGNDNRARRPGA